MTDLSRFADMAEIFAAFVVIGGLLFALVQMRQARQQRRELAASELVRAFGNPQFSEAVRCVLELPDGLDRQALINAYPNAEDHAMLIAMTMENIGVMTYQRIVPFAVVSNLVGGSTGLLWRKLGHWTADLRDELGVPATFEWFQWLAEQLDKLEASNQLPAHEAHRDWTPAKLTQEI